MSTRDYLERRKIKCEPESSPKNGKLIVMESTRIAGEYNGEEDVEGKYVKWKTFIWKFEKK